MFEEDLLTTEYSANDSVFGAGISEGLQAIYQGRRNRFYAAVSTGDRGRRSEFSGAVANGGWAVTGRHERQLLTTAWSTWNDVVGRRGRPRGVLLGIGGGVRSGTDDTGDVLFGTVDASANWHRGQALAYASLRHGDDRSGTRVTNYGALIQAGQFVTDTIQVHGRYEMVAPGTQSGALETYHSATIGCSFLPLRWSNRSKFSVEFGRLFTGVNQTLVEPSTALGFRSSNGPQQYIRLQLQLGH